MGVERYAIVKTGNTSTELSDTLRQLLEGFWRESLEIESTRDGVAFTMPMSYPDGWQVVLELCQKTPNGFYVSDGGKTLSWLGGRGHNPGADSVKTHIERLCREHYLSEEKGVLFRWLQGPLDPVDLQVFAEGLVAIARLDVLVEHRILEEDVAEKTVTKIFRDAGLTPERRHRLNITPDRAVKVDFFINLRRPLAVELIRTKTDLPGTMEKWGFRWRELKKVYQELTPIMLYDRNTQIIDPYSARIGEMDCELFCGYDETDRIHSTLEKVRSEK